MQIEALPNKRFVLTKTVVCNAVVLLLCEIVNLSAESGDRMKKICFYDKK